MNISDGGFPDSHKGGGITPEIFDAFHNELYPGVTKFKKEYVEPASQTGKLHLGFGAHIHTSNPKDDALTLFNVNFQFFSILIPIASAKFDNLLESSGMDKHIKPFNMIHDANYGMVRNDSTIIKWLNDNIVRIMCEDYLIDQLIPLKASIDIGYDLYNVVQLPNNADSTIIQAKLAELNQ